MADPTPENISDYIWAIVREWIWMRIHLFIKHIVMHISLSGVSGSSCWMSSFMTNNISMYLPVPSSSARRHQELLFTSSSSTNDSFCNVSSETNTATHSWHGPAIAIAKTIKQQLNTTFTIATIERKRENRRESCDDDDNRWTCKK